ncbi:hypothetical protein CTI12_AA564170 [Artemisia annua]|uniref:Uncharacterized protein n=1 Tax=Artemisia annua TaxID=35608 RepID=A0A2U1KU59_ARTAN|nr:hypothetical protein CTI12_AA564170 [Artemisia annua]
MSYNFLIELHPRGYRAYDCHEIVKLIGKLPHPPGDFFMYGNGVVAAKFYYQQWPNVLDTIVFLWKEVVDDSFSFRPRLVQNLVVPSDIDELNSSVRVLFRNRVIGLKDGDLVRALMSRVGDVSSEINRLESLLKKRNGLVVHTELNKKKQGCLKEYNLIRRKIREFKWAMDCVVDYLDGKISCSDDVRVLNLKGEFDWNKLDSIINRECRRLKDGLPIFADRTPFILEGVL